jgi:hypothetical protein
MIRLIARYLTWPSTAQPRMFRHFMKALAEALAQERSVLLNPHVVVVEYLVSLVPQLQSSNMALSALRCVVQCEDGCKIVDSRKHADSDLLANAFRVFLKTEWVDAKRLKVGWIFLLATPFDQ